MLNLLIKVAPFRILEGYNQRLTIGYRAYISLKVAALRDCMSFKYKIKKPKWQICANITILPTTNEEILIQL